MSSTTVIASDVIDVDLTDPATYIDGPPHAALDALREASPVAWHAERPVDPTFVPLGGGIVDGAGFWAVTSHELATYVSRRPATFSSWLGGVSLVDFDEAGLASMRQMMITMDPPEHSRLRRLVQPMFAPRTLELMRGLIEGASREVVGVLAEEGECDFVPTVASELPIRVLAALLGMPDEDRHLIVEWTHALMSADDPEFADTAALMKAATDMAEYAQRIVADRRARPRSDLITVLATAEIDGQRLSDSELIVFWNLLVIAGNETTRNAISGSVIALHEHGRWDELRRRPDLLPSATEELLRYVTPVMHFRRTATEDVELGDELIRAGDKVVMFYSAANRDPAVFADPHRLHLDRAPNPHLSFGIGAHICIGAQLARLEMTTLLGEMTRRLRTIEVVGRPRRVRSNFLNLFHELHVRAVPV